MLQIAIAVVVIAVLWVLRTAFYNKAEVYKTQVDIDTTEELIDLQPDIQNLGSKVKEMKEKYGEDWMSMDDIYKLMNR